MRFETSSPEQTRSAGEQLAGSLRPGDVVALFGGMGLGKTVFVQGLARGLGVTDAVTSPTYALVHEYRGTLPLAHFDMYRVCGTDDLYSTGFFDYLSAGFVCAVEWSENIEEALPEDAVRVVFEPGADENTRKITVCRPVRKDDHSI